MGIFVRALNEIRPNSEWIIKGDETLDNLVWRDEIQTKPTQDEIDTAISGLDSDELVMLRQVRNVKLAETDWWVLPDRTATDEQLAYRQALRDITDTYTSLDDVVWPTKPA